MLLEDGDVVFVQMTDSEKAQFLAEVERRMDAKLAMQKVTVERRVQRPRSRMTYLKPEHFPHLYGYAPASDPEDDLKDEQVGQKPEDVIPENVNKIEQLSEPIRPFSPETKRSEKSVISSENLSDTQPSDYTLRMNAAGDRANNNRSDRPSKKHRYEYFCCRGRRSERAIGRRMHFRHWNCSIQ
ncbi:hypothetical protein DdX_19953 [Ditylenchus destructor]|uniref:Uncharacterized protein n=1 Tax=Ditylenchus destructor TaxID=166010 RepID=A0AAD4MLP5_9BILA|nr:hypothetical protein DdX_19953 [Ditylenchus destructor]